MTAKGHKPPRLPRIASRGESGKPFGVLALRLEHASSLQALGSFFGAISPLFVAYGFVASNYSTI